MSITVPVELTTSMSVKQSYFILWITSVGFSLGWNPWYPAPSVAQIESITSDQVATTPGRMRVRSDEFGAFGGVNARGSATLRVNDRTRTWMYSSVLMAADSESYQWLANETEWSHAYTFSGARRSYTPGLSDADAWMDVVSGDETQRVSQFSLDVQGLEVELVQRTPTDDFNYLQQYTFTNPSEDAIEATIAWFGDLDLTPDFSDHVGFATDSVPRIYFLTGAEVQPGTDNGTEDREFRMTIAADMGEGLSLDGIVAARGSDTSNAGAHALYAYMQKNKGIAAEDLNTFREFDVRTSFDDISFLDADVDADHDGLSDRPGEVGGAMQFQLSLPAGASTTLTLDYIGGSLDNSMIDLGLETTLRGDFDADGVVGLADLQDLVAAMNSDPMNSEFDLTGDGQVNSTDLSVMVTSPDLLSTYFGDANLDGEFNSGDLVIAFMSGEYEDDIEANSRWSTGDWNGDGEFNSGDLVVAFGDGGFELGPRTAAVAAVPEPMFTTWWGFAGLSAGLRCRFAMRIA